MYREYDNLKFTRTYVGGSKDVENIAFFEAQGIQEDCSDCDWLKYRNLLIEYFEDKIQVSYSWSILINRISILLLISFVTLLPYHTIYSPVIILLPLSILFQLLYRYLEHLLRKKIAYYNYCLTTTHNQIKEIFGIELN